MACLVIPSEGPSANLGRRRCSYDIGSGAVLPRSRYPAIQKQSSLYDTSDNFMRIQSVGHLSCEPDHDPDLFCLIQQASLGLQRYSPELAHEGDGGTYYLHNIAGELLGVFKPSDEDPQSQNNPKKKQRRERYSNRRRSSNCIFDDESSSSRSSSSSSSSSSFGYSSTAVRTSIPRGQTAIREVAAYALDRKFAGVPPTTLARVQGWESSRVQRTTMSSPARGGNVLPKRLNANGGCTNGCRSPMPQMRWHVHNQDEKAQNDTREPKVGSLQKFVTNECGSCDRAPQKYSVEDVQKIAILDMRIFNTDRHGGNMLVVRKDQPNEDGIFYSLVPIDHGYSFPINLSEANFEWMYWPQARVPFPAHLVRYVEEIDIAEDEELLRKCGIEEEAICVNRISTMLLKEGVKQGLNLQEIARLCCGDRGQSGSTSQLENVVASVVAPPGLPSLADEDVWITLQGCLSEMVARIAAER